MRSCIGYIKSMFYQSTKRAYDMPYLYDIMTDQNKILYAFNDKMEDWIKRLGMDKFIFKSYHEAAAKGLIEDFCETLNIRADPRFVYPGNRNITPSKAYLAFMLPLNFIPIKNKEYHFIASETAKVDQKINADFDCNFIPSCFYKNPSNELVQTIKRQGELHNDPTWLDRFYSEAKTLSDDDGLHDLPAHLQHAFYNNMTKESKRILRKYLPIEINNSEKPFLPSIEELSPEQFKLQIESRRNFIIKRKENEQLLKTRRPILFRILWLKRKAKDNFKLGQKKFKRFAHKTIFYRAYATLYKLVRK